MLPSEKEYKNSRAYEWLLESIKKENSNRKATGIWEYHFHDENIDDMTIPPLLQSYHAQQFMLWALEKSWAIRIQKVSRTDRQSSVFASPAYNLDPRYPTWYVSPPRKPLVAYFEIREPDFSRVYDAFATQGKEKWEELFIFTLTKDGVLSRTTPMPGDTPYSMEKGSRRHRVMKALASSKNERYCSTTDLAEQAACENGEFRRTCGEIRAQLGQHFSGLNSKDVIESKTRSGYRINPKARIVQIP